MCCLVFGLYVCGLCFRIFLLIVAVIFRVVMVYLVELFVFF
jgi:hypothetical protein